MVLLQPCHICWAILSCLMAHDVGVEEPCGSLVHLVMLALLAWMAIGGLVVDLSKGGIHVVCSLLKFLTDVLTAPKIIMACSAFKPSMSKVQFGMCYCRPRKQRGQTFGTCEQPHAGQN